jgi:hypothetical protein
VGFRASLLCAVAFLVGAVPAGAETPSLARDVTLSGDHAGYTRVVLPAPLEPFGEPHSLSTRLEVAGKGPYVGFALVSKDAREFGDHFVFMGLKEGDGGSFLGQLDKDGKLPAGEYRLYLLMTTGHTVVRLHLPELSGTLTAEPAVYTPMEVAGLEERPYLDSPVTFRYGHSGTLKSSGLFVAHWTADYGMSAGSAEECVYMDGMDDSGDLAYGPTCPGGISFYDPVFSTYLPMWSVNGSFSAGEVAPGRYGFGGNVTFLGAKPKIGGSAAWIGFEPLPGSSQPRLAAPVRLTLALVPKVVRAGRRVVLRMRVTAAGKPVPGASVRVGARRGLTNAAGIARIRFRAPRSGVARVTATHSGMRPARATLRVRR